MVSAHAFRGFLHGDAGYDLGATSRRRADQRDGGCATMARTLTKKPVRMSQLRDLEDVQEVVVTLGDDIELWMLVDPNKFTLGMMKKVERAQADQDLGAMADLFFGAVPDWDLEDDDGIKMPRTEETIDEFGMQTFRKIMEKISEQLSPKATTSNS